LLGKEDQITDDTITSEEKWSLYVDQFVQLSTTESVTLKRSDPFLKRNLPLQVGEDPPLNVETRSGLELKICVNTYKIFFVDNTEDYFRRKANNGKFLGLSLNERENSEKLKRNSRSEKMLNWVESLTGWKAGLSEQEALHLNKAYESWKKGPVA
jgi:paired amphipathic helix protein Sin3a